MFHSILTTE